ncbi:MAG: DNA polymerase III subunit delta' [Bauldia sp.]|nr:DNA polymerase III subunit delta' [Bauldia sp.]
MAAAADPQDVPRIDRLDGWPLPDSQSEWFGDPAVETTLLDAYRGGRMHHAWLIGGPKGIGKATLAYRFARFVLAHPDPQSAEVAAATSLAIPPDAPVFRRVAGRGHPNLLALERPYREDRKRFLTDLNVDEVRRTVSFFGSTGGEQGWRIAVVDPADEMNASAANALLKVLEEPPRRSLFFVISHAPGRLLPTIRSRCRRIELSPLSDAAIAGAIRASRPGEFDDDDIALAASLSEGSLRRAILLLQEDGIAGYRQFAAFAATLPNADVGAMHALADAVSKRGADDAYDGFLDTVRGWLGRRVRGEGEPAGEPAPTGVATRLPLARWAEVWEKVTETSAEAEALNLDRKQVVLSILMSFAQATRM